MTWDFVEQNTFSLVFPSQKLYFYPDLSIELKVAMLLENPKTGTLGIVYESAISEKTVPTFFFTKKKCSKMKLHELYIDGKKKCQSFARHGSENGRKSHILYTRDFNWMFQVEIDPLARIANSYYTAVKNDVRYVNKAAIAVF